MGKAPIFEVALMRRPSPEFTFGEGGLEEALAKCREEKPVSRQVHGIVNVVHGEPSKNEPRAAIHIFYAENHSRLGSTLIIQDPESRDWEIYRSGDFRYTP